MRTTGCVVKTIPATAPLGWVEILAWAARPSARGKGAEWTATPEAVVKRNVRFSALPVIARSVNVATPATAATVRVFDTVCPVCAQAMTSPVKDVTVWPAASVRRTTGCVVMISPLMAPPGSVTIIRGVVVAARTVRV